MFLQLIGRGYYGVGRDVIWDARRTSTKERCVIYSQSADGRPSGRFRRCA
jgi:hypothetical protein